ncbi:MAG: V-type ATP synthase subunit I [Clostridia bacterium]|nr:V-type ATP synthase subunit I [Clostridia bacterium]
MAISEMRRVSVIGHESRIDEVVRVLQHLGAVEVSEYGEGLASEEKPTITCPYDPTERLSELDSILADLKYTIDMMGKHRRITKSILENFTGYRLYMTESEWKAQISDGADNVRRLCGRAREIEESMADLSARRTRIASSIEFLEPWEGFKGDSTQLGPGPFVTISLGTADSKGIDSRMEAAASSVPGIAWGAVAAEPARAYMLVAYPTSVSEEAARALSEAGFARVSLDQCSGSPGDEIRRLREELDGISKASDNLEREIDSLVEERPRAFALYDHFSLDRARYYITTKFGGTARTFLVEGWVQQKDMGRFRAAILQIADDIVVQDRPPLEDEIPPVELINGKLAQPFEVITKTMGYPAPGSIDPTPFLAPFFLVFFGLCMTDAVYGLIIAGVALLLMRKMKGRGTQFLNLILACGLATVVVGALLGGWLGDLPTRLFGWRTAILFDPMQSPTTFLILSFGLGIVHIFTGLGIKAYDNVRKGRWLSAIYDQGFWVLFLVGIGLTLGGGSLGPGFSSVAENAKYAALGGAAGLVATQGRHHKNPLQRLGGGVLSLYATTGYMSDIISYARLFGLGFTSTVLASVMNDLMLRPAGIPIIGPVIAVIGLAFGHVFNILINIIGAYVHSSRLQYVEFFGKFFEAGGRRFMPFGAATKYVDVETTKGV